MDYVLQGLRVRYVLICCNVCSNSAPTQFISELPTMHFVAVIDCITYESFSITRIPGPHSRTIASNGPAFKCI
uniref:Uncharacterized protein n=1 Tax=Rhizophora mucronata TaxID=61149 RepID=A0A2P2LL27_RHIMU